MSVRQFDSMPVHTRPGGTAGLGWARYERLSKLTRVGVTVSVLYLRRARFGARKRETYRSLVGPTTRPLATFHAGALRGRGGEHEGHS